MSENECQNSACPPEASGFGAWTREPAAPAPPRGSGETILLVDDEAAILTIAGQTLEAFGYRALLAHDGAEAVAIYAQHRQEIAAVVTDIAMPLMDGHATIRALRQIDPTVKIIAASGFARNNGGSKQANETTKHFLAKPYTAAALLEAVRSVLSEDPARQ